MRYILAVDQSTSATKGILFNEGGQLVKRVTIEHEQIYPQSGWVEHNPITLYENTIAAGKQVVAESGVCIDDVVSFAISNQRETCLVWDKQTGEPIYNAIVWQCSRAEGLCAELRDSAEMVQKKSGLVLSPYFSAAKIAWILRNVEGAREKAEQGKLCFGTVDSWLLFRLTGTHVTDFSNACRTQLFNIHTLQWDSDLFTLFDVPPEMAPEVRGSDEIFGTTAVFGKPLPICGVMGDSHAALFGQACFSAGMAKATFGTGSSVMMNVGEKPIMSTGGLVSSLAWGYRGNVSYVLEGNINFAGATTRWMVDVGLLSDSKSSGKIAETVCDNGGVYFVPAFAGLGAPYWDSTATAAISGLTIASKNAHIVRAGEECIAYQIMDIVSAMETDSKQPLSELRTDGGPTRDRFLMQFLSDMLETPVACSEIEELSALGVAYMSGLTVGVWKDMEEISTMRTAGNRYHPQMQPDIRQKNATGWHKAVANVRNRE